MDPNRRPSYPPPPPPQHHSPRYYSPGHYGVPPTGTAALTPTSASTAGSFPSPPGGPPQAQMSSGYAPMGGRGGYPYAEQQVNQELADMKKRRDDTNSDGSTERKRRKTRNKPTLSCQECVERKTKCDRGRPHCLACIKRETDCQYSSVATLMEDTNRTANNGQRMTKGPKKRSPTSFNGPLIPNIADRGAERDTPPGAVAHSVGLLSNIPYSIPSSSNVFGIGSEHPFANYWTLQGGLAEVVAVLPEKVQADTLIHSYFECVDPVYPMIHRQTFYAEYEHFWSQTREQKNGADADFLALIFVMLALGTQFVSPQQFPAQQLGQKQSAEFQASASNQALRMSSYLSTASIKSIQAMVLMTYFLINDNHASDGWAFSGILVRQAYAMGLHRNPDHVTPNTSPFDKQQRRKLWQAVLLQDTFLTVLLSLPPSTTHSDVLVTDLLDADSAIASSDPTDTAYIRASWTLASLVQDSICSPRSLDIPICNTQRQKTKLIQDFRTVYRSFPDIFRCWDEASLTALAETNKRVVRQTLFLTSNYFHNLMLVHGSDSGPEVPVNYRGTAEAAHDAISSFFMMFKLLTSEAMVWWVFNHRAFLEAVCIGNVLTEVAELDGGRDKIRNDPVYAAAKRDISRMIEIMEIMSAESEVARTRVTLLRAFLTS